MLRPPGLRFGKSSAKSTGQTEEERAEATDEELRHGENGAEVEAKLAVPVVPVNACEEEQAKKGVMPCQSPLEPAELVTLWGP